MLGAAVRCFSVNPRAFHMSLFVIPLLDTGSRQELMAASDGHGSTALMDACVTVPPSISLVRKLLAAGAQAVINASDTAGQTALMLAAQRDFSAAVRHLVDSSANIEQRDNGGRTALQHACEARMWPSMAALLASDAPLDASTLLSCAIPLGATWLKEHAAFALISVVLFTLIVGGGVLGPVRTQRIGGLLRPMRQKLQRLCCAEWRVHDADVSSAEARDTSLAEARGVRNRRRRPTQRRHREIYPKGVFVQSAETIARRLGQALRHPAAKVVLRSIIVFAAQPLSCLLVILFGSHWSGIKSGTPHGAVPFHLHEPIFHVLVQVLTYLVAVALSASGFPDVGDEDGMPTDILGCYSAAPIVERRERSVFLNYSRGFAVLYLGIHWSIYTHALLTPLQSFDGLSLLSGREALTLSTWIRFCVSMHLAIWMVLPLPFVVGGLQLTEGLRTLFPPWAVFRCGSCAIGLNDLALRGCLGAYLRTITAGGLTAGGHNPLPVETTHQLYLLYDRACAHTCVHLTAAILFTPRVRLRLAVWRGMLAKGSLGKLSSPGIASDSGEKLQRAAGASNKEESLLCVICMDEGASCILAPCGHMCACVSCSNQLVECPLCRHPVQSTVERVWYSVGAPLDDAT
jgi:hypothetical protein